MRLPLASMVLHVNHRLIRRQLRISAIYLVVALGFLMAGFVVSLPEGRRVLPEDPFLQYLLPMPSLAIGLLLWFRNQAYLARWGPRSRQDAVLARGLRGLDDRHHLVAFAHPALPDYLILGPMGALVVIPRAVTGVVTCYDDRWRQEERRSAVGRILGWLAPRATLGNPTTDAQRGIQGTYRFLASRLPEDVQDHLRVDAAVAFTAPRVELRLHGCPVPAVHLKSLRGYVRRLPKGLTPGELTQLVGVIQAA